MNPNNITAKKQKVLVAMSGGIDTSVSAFLLKERGFEVVGLTMCLGVKVEENEPVKCCGPEAIMDAKNVCKKLGIPHYVMDFSNDLEENVIKRFVGSYLSGETPNPCIDCNKYLKFGSLLEKAKTMGFDFLATGHYACIIKRGENYFLKKPRDLKKDQTYFLYAIKKEDLKKILFPLCSYTKREIKEIAIKLGMPVADKKESQDICFVPGKNYKEFLKMKLKNKKALKTFEPGSIIDPENNIIGKHNGLPFYTIGQRKGLGISYNEPLYVTKIDKKNNRIIAGTRKNLQSTSLAVRDLNFFTDELPKSLKAKIRYNHPEADCSIKLKNDLYTVKFKEEQEAITPGQAIVFYDKDILIGGGVIEGSIPEK